MIFDLMTIPHPSIRNRNITHILIDNNIDLPSTRFLTYESRYGGRFSSISGISTHRERAVKLRELFKHLHQMGLTWKTATESDIKTIRNKMLHLDSNGNKENSNNSNQEKPVSNNSMNLKLNVWFKFYKYMASIGESFDLTLTTKMVQPYRKDTLLSHLQKRRNFNDQKIEVWSLYVKSSPEKRLYHAISRTVFEHLRRELRKQDIVFEMIAYLMVETGLRVSAALSVTQESFKKYFQYLNTGLSVDSCIKMDYIAKGDKKLQCDLPIRTIATIQKDYLSRLYIKRLKKHSDQGKKGKFEYNPSAMWLLSNGREVNYSDIYKAFCIASSALGRNVDRITPHWMRHTCATWALIDFARAQNIPLQHTGVKPHPLFMQLLAEKLGHVDETTTMKYVVSALALMEVTSGLGPIMSFQTFTHDKKAQELVQEEAKMEFGDHFDEKRFDALKYALSRKIIVYDS